MKKICAGLLCLTLLAGCTPKIPQEALELSPENMQNRQLQTRRFETTDKSTMLAAASAVLQDMGYTLEETEVPLGVLTASKQRDATSGAQVAGAIFVALLTGAVMPMDKSQTIRVSIVMRENQTGKDSIVRTTFQRIVVTTQNLVRVAEQINDADIYKEFYEKLSKSVFLEAHEI